MNRRIQIIRRTIFDTREVHANPILCTHQDTIVRVYGKEGKADSADFDREELLMIIAKILTGGVIDTALWTMNGKPVTDHKVGTAIQRTITSADHRNYLYHTPHYKVTGIEILLDAGECIIDNRQHWKTRVTPRPGHTPLFGENNFLTSAEFLAEAANTLNRR